MKIFIGGATFIRDNFVPFVAGFFSAVLVATFIYKYFGKEILDDLVDYKANARASKIFIDKSKLGELKLTEELEECRVSFQKYKRLYAINDACKDINSERIEGSIKDTTERLMIMSPGVV